MSFHKVNFSWVIEDFNQATGDTGGISVNEWGENQSKNNGRNRNTIYHLNGSSVLLYKYVILARYIDIEKGRGEQNTNEGKID